MGRYQGQVAGQLTLSARWHAVPSFPTAVQVWLRLPPREEYGA